MAARPEIAGAGAVGTASALAVLPGMTVDGSADLLTHAAGPERTGAVAFGPAIYAFDAPEAAATDTPGLQMLAQEACQHPVTPGQLTHPSAGCGQLTHPSACCHCAAGRESVCA